ncbi:MerR family transcriptional regulator [Pseudotabrizicola sp. 4114]|uniref:MerR family transcriptional regulator n=1 Tax=Pseudotabrizicola sp. 4114 TaxID=2817731 RepID=UPI00285FA9AC|nr:DNA-binding transcriptional MerR regulator [Pseudorhodobacter sp. 4114]
MNKSPDAFRTISEVADLLETPAHVLRFWESRFPQIRPVKRAGGRRYYRPADVALLTGIKRLLHEEGLTIRGVQKILREQGVRHVSGVSDDSTDMDEDDDLATALAQATGSPELSESLPPAEAETAQIIALQAALRAPVVTPPAPVAELPEPEADGPAGWQDDSEAEEAGVSLPDDDPPHIAEPPPPVTAEPVPTASGPTAPPTSAPVVADLFSRAPPPPPVAPPSMPETPVAEAPMAVWADEAETQDLSPDESADSGSRGSVPPLALRITRIGAPPVPAPAEAAESGPTVPEPAKAEPAKAEPAPAEPAPAEPEPAPPQAMTEHPVVITGPTLAQRLRAVPAADLSPADRQRLTDIRDQALTLRARLSGPARAQG